MDVMERSSSGLDRCFDDCSTGTDHGIDTNGGYLLWLGEFDTPTALFVDVLDHRDWQWGGRGDTAALNAKTAGGTKAIRIAAYLGWSEMA